MNRQVRSVTKRLWGVFLAVLLPTLSLAQPSAVPTRMSDAEATQQAKALLHRMTLAEKIGQMEQTAGQPMYTPPAEADRLASSGESGNFLFFTDPVRINELQKLAVTKTRLHIPLTFGYDVIHGFRTIAPIPLAMAASWDPALVTRTAAMAAREARAAGITLAFGPMVDIARDARWGRIMEGAGEDPYLGSRMAAAQVRGFQGDYIGESGHILACVKHFAGYGAANGGRDYDETDISDELLWNVYLPPFHAAVKAGAATFMSAYQSLNGVPATGNAWLLRDVLRDTWGFKGAVLSDWDSVKSLQTHGFASSPADAAIRAAYAGVNMEMTSTTYRDHLPEAVEKGEISEATIDALVLPILKLKYQMGLFANPYVDVDHFKRETGSSEQRKSVRVAAEQTAVLLRNENSLLPLSKDLHSIAVIGPLADSKLDTMGSWAIHGDRRDTVTVADGLRELLPQTKIAVTKGVEIERGSPTIFDEQVPPEKPQFTTPAEKKAEFDRALDLARQSEVSILVLGEAQTMSGENASRARLSLPGEQEKLLQAVTALGKPVVLVLMTGRPLDISWASEHVPAILNIWYPGTEGGHAVANLLFGEANPSGHLPVTWPREAGQEPLFYNYKLPQNPENKAHRYWDMTSSPLYPFGYGLSYSSFSLSKVAVESPHVNLGTPLRATVTLRNTSRVAGAQVVQLYIHQRAGGTSRPNRELKAFEKVLLAPGESREITLTVPAQELSYWSPVLRHQVLEPGAFDVWVGFDSTTDNHATFQVTGGLGDVTAVAK